MRNVPVPAATLAVAVVSGLIAPSGHAAQGATDPFEANVFAGAAYEDNLFRLESESEGLASLGIDDLEDWFRYAGAGFRSNFAGAQRRFELDGEIYRQTYDTYDSLDHTGGHFNASGEWELARGTDATLGYGYQRRLQSFTNKDSAREDVVQQHGVNAAIEHTLAQRWQVRAMAGYADLNFSTSEFLDKELLETEAELRYAASQNSVFGLLGTWTESDFDVNDNRDFSGWSLGPSFEWQITGSFQLSANVGYTHRGLDDAEDLDDYDGVTGYVATLWSPGERFSSDLRVFRDVSNLGGEVSEYTERTGLRWRPTWRMTPKLATRVIVAYEERDFTAVEGAEDRTDDFLLTELWLDFDVTRRLLWTLGYAYETRDSNVDEQNFDAHVVRTELRFSF